MVRLGFYPESSGELWMVIGQESDMARAILWLQYMYDITNVCVCTYG